MSIKTSIKDHFSNNHLKSHFDHNALKNQWINHKDHFANDKLENEVSKKIYDDKIVLRKFSWSDLDECVELYKKVFSAHPWYDEWRSSGQVRIYLNELISNPVFKGFIIREDSKVVAVCMGRSRSWWMGKEFYVDEFFVENERQGNGIGTKLLDYVTGILSKEGYRRLILLTNKEIPAETFYLKKGFSNNLKRTVMVKEI